MRPAVLIVASLVALDSLGPARADVLRPLRVKATLDEATASFHVHYTAAVTESTFGDLGEFLLLPERAVITAGIVSDVTGPHALDLIPAQRATDTLAALAERPGNGGRRWALALTGELAFPNIRIAAPHPANLRLDLAISAPTCFHGDHRYVAVPESWRDILPPELRVPAGKITAVQADCGGDASGQRVWAGFSTKELAGRPAGVHRIGGVASRIALGGLHIAKVEITVASQLGDVPADLATAILVDASRSMTPQQLEAQRELVERYLRAAPGSQVQVLAYARDVRPLLPAWTPATSAIARVDRELRGLVRRNGSNLDAAMREAAAWLSRIGGTHRIIVLGDVRLADRIGKAPAQSLGSLVPPRTLVHTVEISELGTGLVRNDEGLLHPVASATRGMNVHAGIADLDATMLARPTSLDHATLATAGWTALRESTACPPGDGNETTLAEGSSCTWYGNTGRLDGQPLVLTGMLWGERVSRVIRPEPSRALELARELSAAHFLDERHQPLADLAARAVNSAWSLYGEWGPPGGYGDGDVHISGRPWATMCGRSCTGDSLGLGRGTGRLMGADPRLAETFEAILERCTPRKHPGLRAVVETTGEEIVDLTVTSTDAGLRKCAEDVLWNAWLIVPHAPMKSRTTVDIEARL